VAFGFILSLGIVSIMEDLYVVLRFSWRLSILTIGFLAKLIIVLGILEVSSNGFPNV